MMFIKMHVGDESYLHAITGKRNIKDVSLLKQNSNDEGHIIAVITFR